MVWRRRPTKRTTKVEVDPKRTGRFTEKNLNENPANSWQQWLIPTSLCEAITNVVFNDRMDQGIPMTWGRDMVDPLYHRVAVAKGETCIYTGELYRRKIRDVFAPGGVRIEVAHKFFSPRHGPIIADPSFFKDALADDVKDDGTV
jgi:hypothetical protein